MTRKFLLLAIFKCSLVVLAMKAYEYKISLTSFPNYLYLGAVDLKQHAIALESLPGEAVMFFGSSAVAGSNVPPSTSVSDYFQKQFPKEKVFNLGVHQANIFDSLTYLKLAKQYQKPKLVIMGISPEYFPNHFPATRVLSKNLKLLSSVLSAEQIEGLTRAASKKMFSIEEWLKGDRVKIPSNALLRYRTWLHELSLKLYGPMMSASLVGKGVTLSNITEDNLSFEILNIVKQQVEADGGRLLVFLEPQLHVDRFFGKQEFQAYKDLIQSKLRQYGIPYFDYVSIFPNDAVHFVDFIHLTPMAYKKLAKKLAGDIQSEGLL